MVIGLQGCTAQGVPDPTTSTSLAVSTTTTGGGGTTTTITTTTSTTTTTLAPATVTGLVYERQPATAYTLTGPFSPALSGAAVTLSAESAISDGAGNFSLTSPAFGDLSTYAAKSGFITTKVTTMVASAKSYDLQLGLYPTTTVTARPGFIKGMALWDAGGWLLDWCYANNYFQSTSTNARDKAGANLVTVSDPVFITTVGTMTVTMSTESNTGTWWRMMNAAEYGVLAADAHGKGLQFMMWLGVMDDGKSTQLDGKTYNDIVGGGSGKASSAFWNAWFGEYKKYTKQYATIAKDLGIEYICLGHDMGYAINKGNFTSEAEVMDHWRTIVYGITAEVGYTGKLMVFAGSGPYPGNWGDDDLPTGFMDLLDYMGYAVQDVNPTFNPSVNDLKSSLSSFLTHIQGNSRPAVIMIRTPSVDGGTSISTFIEPLVEVNPVANSHNLNLAQQADIYEAWLESINGTPTGNGRVMGIVSWNYHYIDNYHRGNSNDHQMAMDKASNIRGKPAEAVAKWWYDRF
jgi:hypothetical protein